QKVARALAAPGGEGRDGEPDLAGASAWLRLDIREDSAVVVARDGADDCALREPGTAGLDRDPDRRAGLAPELRRRDGAGEGNRTACSRRRNEDRGDDRAE